VRLTVQSGDGPYGSVMWQEEQYVTARPAQAAALTTLYLTRTGGSQGHLQIFYR